MVGYRKKDLAEVGAFDGRNDSVVAFAFSIQLSARCIARDATAVALAPLAWPKEDRNSENRALSRIWLLADLNMDE